MPTVTITPETLDAAFVSERDVLGVIFALYELVLPGFDRNVNGTDDDHPTSSHETWVLVDEAFDRWVKNGNSRHKTTLRKQWPWATLDYAFREVPGMPLGMVDGSGVTVTVRARP